MHCKTWRRVMKNYFLVIFCDSKYKSSLYIEIWILRIFVKSRLFIHIPLPDKQRNEVPHLSNVKFPLKCKLSVIPLTTQSRTHTSTTTTLSLAAAGAVLKLWHRGTCYIAPTLQLFPSPVCSCPLPLHPLLFPLTLNPLSLCPHSQGFLYNEKYIHLEKH